MAASSRKVVIAALIGNGLIAITKFVASVLTGSSAMLSEGIHSLVDTGNQFLLLLGLRRAKKPPDKEFPFGHGKEIYFWSFVVAILIFAVGAGVSMYEGVRHLLHPRHVTDTHINYIVLAFAFVFEGAAWLFAYKAFNHARGRLGLIAAVQRGKDPSLFVVLFEDSAAMLGIVVAFLGVFLAEVTGNPYFDGAASIVIGLILGVTAIWLAIESKGLLIGEAADPDVVRGIHKIAESYRGISHVNEVLTLHMGPEYVLLNLSVEFSDRATTDNIEDAIHQLTSEIKYAFPDVKRVFIEPEARENTTATNL